jgi:hypothetical protein
VNSNFLVVLAEILVWVTTCLILLAVSSWLIFSPWYFVDKGARGFHALTLSKHLSHHRLGAVMWRLFCILFYYSVATFALSFVLSFFFYFLSPVGGAITAMLITIIVGYLFFVPLTYCMIFALYNDVSSSHSVDTESRAHGEHYGFLLVLAILGFLGVCALPSLTSIGTPMQMHGPLFSGQHSGLVTQTMRGHFNQ